MAISNKHGPMVVATGNKSEMAAGYATLYGDMVGGYAVLKDVFKTLVYELARWRNKDGEVIPQNSIDKPPSAELRPGPEGLRLSAAIRGAGRDPRALHRRRLEPGGHRRRWAMTQLWWPGSGEWSTATSTSDDRPPRGSRSPPRPSERIDVSRSPTPTNHRP